MNENGRGPEQPRGLANRERRPAKLASLERIAACGTSRDARSRRVRK